jgi:UDP-glucose 4-epimerase
MKTKALFAPSTVLITGGAGFIGNYIVKRFLKSGVSVHVLDNLSTGTLNNIPPHPNLIFHHGSILDKPFLRLLKKFNFDLILHLASIVGMRLATKYQPLVYQTATT